MDTFRRTRRRTTVAKVAVIYYSSTGNVHALATSLAEGAEAAGAEVRLRRAAELAPDAAIDANPAWRAHLSATADIPLASHEDLRWADAYAFGTPARFGNVSSQLKQFIDTTAGLWAAGELADKPATCFTSAINRHGGNESTLLALYNSMYHWGAIIVPPGYTDQAFSLAGGNPYGTAHPSGEGLPSEQAAEAARRQGERLARIAARLADVGGKVGMGAAA
jgi:NAD(P)H dehydrogenase (quinone)